MCENHSALYQIYCSPFEVYCISSNRSCPSNSSHIQIVAPSVLALL
uniref:Uncharacterized protein n=1 Tax=Amphimedon queenslandica TaxID=400682 RepID=A0A1X7VKD1_AMPQE